MRTVDVARRAGYSVQQVRNLERDGVLPPARRTASGHRVYGEVHLRSALAYRALAAGTGPVEAKGIMRAAHGCPAPGLLALLDTAHARLDRERGDLTLAREAAEAISAEPIGEVRPSDAMGVSELAAALGVRPSTLRHWDTEGLVVPDRVSVRGTRRYSPAQVRDARIVHQLRGAGYRVETIRRLVPDLPRGRRSEEVEAALAARDASIAVRSRALLDAAAEIAALLRLTEDPSP
ncbi:MULTISPECIES: MerR family transcriptional regulator [unclassified Nocardiopsis]|uniref:MerR family transcriptional regulator n=1 Tax=unclassified Nocardiopsis TaxID=2649073 RepID=UPI0009F8E35C|nr:MerR family transcriptional regulator [Nocardiopsis sp. TSRI0078]